MRMRVLVSSGVLAVLLLGVGGDAASQGLPTVAVRAEASQSARGWPERLVHWQPAPARPLFSGGGDGAWDERIRERGWILLEGETYHLFYTGYNEDRSPLRMLGHATSVDGLHWVRDERNPLFDQGWVEDMCVVPHDGGYLMFAEGEGDIAHLLASDDLIHWTERGPLDIRLTTGEPISPGPRGTPFVMRKDDLWHLFYERGDLGVWLATSPDLTIWTNVSDDPVLPMGPEPYDLHAVALNQVIEEDDGYYYAVYHANAHRPWRDWTTCLARSKDLLHWEKYPGNPIVGDNRSSGVFLAGPDGRRDLYTMHPDVRRFTAAPPAAEALGVEEEPQPQPQR